MSFGFSVGDFLAVGQVVLKLYNACKDAPAEFKELSGELSSIHTVLFSLAEQARDPTSLLLRYGRDRGLEWSQIRENLEGTLGVLQDLVSRYQTMGRNAWRRVRLGSENLGDTRSKLGFHLSVISTFIGSLALSALGRMEPVLGRIEVLLREAVREERAGQKTPTLLTAYSSKDMVSWKQVEMDLLIEGITKEDFERHRNKIRELLVWIVSTEADLAGLEEVTPNDSVSCVSINFNPFGPIYTGQFPALPSMDGIFGPSAPSLPMLDTVADFLTISRRPPPQFNAELKKDFDSVFDNTGTPSKIYDVFQNVFDRESDSNKDHASVWERLDREAEQDRQTAAYSKSNPIIHRPRLLISPSAIDPLSFVDAPSRQPEVVDAEPLLDYQSKEETSEYSTDNEAPTITTVHQLESTAVLCDNCDVLISDQHFHCPICNGNDFDLCNTCIKDGYTCKDNKHRLIKRFVVDGVITYGVGFSNHTTPDPRRASPYCQIEEISSSDEDNDDDVNDTEGGWPYRDVRGSKNDDIGEMGSGVADGLDFEDEQNILAREGWIRLGDT